jgi:phage baseplate assembly protein V
MDYNSIINSIRRLYSRILNTVARGRVTATDDSKSVQILQISLNANELRDNIARISEYGFTSNPPAGTDVVVVFIGGDRSNGAVIGTNNQAARMKNLASGEVAIHDNQGKYIYISQSGIVIEANSHPVTVNDATVVTINASTEVILNTPILKVSGDIIDNYQTNTDNMSGMRAKYNSHTHPGVQTGSGSTGTPSVLE